MDVLLFISKFIYRIRYKLFVGTLLTTLFVAYFTQFMPKTYTVNTSIYTGFASNTGLDEDSKTDWLQLNSTFDNLINLVRAKKTLENVSIQLFAQDMIYGNPVEDNLYINAKTFRDLQKIVPKDVAKLIDKNSFEKTVENLKNYKQEMPDNFMFNLFNLKHPHYSYSALKDVVIKRIGNSDMLEISYKTNDPGIALNTVKLINVELVKSYDDLRYNATKDVSKYYDEQLKKLKSELRELEDTLTEYNVRNRIINYSEQTKAIAISFTDYENRYEQAMRDYKSSSELIAKFEGQMDVKNKLTQNNSEFLKALDEVSTINRKITEIEIFNTGENLEDNKELQEYRNKLKEVEKNISKLSNNINEYKYSKEGVSLESVVGQWLMEVIKNTKVKAELSVLDERRNDFNKQYETFSPIGTQLKRKEREIQITEQAYLDAMHGLNLALQKQKNIQLTSASLTTITPPSYPLFSDGSKRSLFVVASFIGSFVFILGCCLVIELMDRTLRDPLRAERLTGIEVLGALIGWKHLKYRGYTRAINRKATAYICNRIHSYNKIGKTTIINLISTEAREGKSFLAKYMIDYWALAGMKVKYVSYDVDFMPKSKEYVYASNYGTLLPNIANEEFDILLVECAPLSLYSIPLALLKEANINLLVANARRVWKESDTMQVKALKETSTPLYMLLNNANRNVVEEFTGQLPPYSSEQSFIRRIFLLGLTAENTAVK